MELEVKTYTLNFTFTARTSRGTMTDRKVWFLELIHQGILGIGEVAPIPRLSPDNFNGLEEVLEDLVVKLKKLSLPNSKQECFSLAASLIDDNFPSVRFGLEMALLDLLGGGIRQLFTNEFSVGKKTIPINGLVWMSGKNEMIRQIDEKLAEGYECIKLKVGALDFKEELELLKYLRNRAPEITIRLDANGAFATKDVLAKLKEMSVFDIHSIEQPIAPDQDVSMRLVIQKSPIPIALDEELIGIYNMAKDQLLDTLKPPFIVLKPTLLGGFQQTEEWIKLAEKREIGWWITSYLESNIGLTAIAQFVGNYDVKLPQGLGTGMLYSNNIDSELSIAEGRLHLKSETS